MAVMAAVAEMVAMAVAAAATTAMVMMATVQNIFFTAGMKPRNPCFLSESSLTPSLIWNGNAEERRFASQKPLPEPWLFHREVRSFHLIIGSQTFGFPGPVLGPPGDQSLLSVAAASSGATLSPSTLQTRDGDRREE